MLVEESMHIAFDETNQNMQENSKTSADDEFPNIQQADIGLKNKLEDTNKLLNVQSDDQGVQSIESRVGTDAVNSRLPREWRVPRNLSLDNIFGQMHKGVSTRRTLNKTTPVNVHVVHVKREIARCTTCHCNSGESTSQKLFLRYFAVKYNLL